MKKKKKIMIMKVFKNRKNKKNLKKIPILNKNLIQIKEKGKIRIIIIMTKKYKK